MRRVYLSLLISAFAITTPAHAQLFKKKDDASPPGINAPSSFADLAERLSPAVVNISSTQKMSETSEDLPEMPEFPPGSPFEEFFKEFQQRRGGDDGEPMPGTPASSLGSGFIIDAEKGLIVTNNHVIRDADEVRVTLHDDTTLDAKILGKDDKTDLALLQVTSPNHKLVAVPFGNSDEMRVGDWVVAIGNPFGLGGTVTSGIISARARDINSGPYDDFIQTDASINRGNSGGPMFNLKGEVIGINTAIFSPTGGSVGIGFAIPSNLAKPIVDQLVRFGKTKRGWLGIRIQTVTPEIADSLGLKESGGALVASITPKGPAEIAKLQPGDVLLEFNNQKLTGMRQLPRLVAETPIGTDAKVLYWRDGKTLTTSVKVGELEKAESEGLIESGEVKEKAVPGTDITGFGVTVTSLSDSLREAYEIPENAKGVVVTAVKNNSEAAEKGLQVGDVIVEINQQAVEDAAGAKKIVDDAQKAGKSSALLLVDHQGRGDVRFVALRFKAPAAKETPKTDRQPK
ncbi:MAG: serine protease [Micavibrio aeruginosavorus]|uniref:Probable periplasmic serine endoprotease DegP-like n=1 Tax=Micavibrio aeruginosavorus TaxID=349221 RepID=A0A2W5FI08_9BACT|nr:MAG: serine protease [Micavibrio aeruginosavorus]